MDDILFYKDDLKYSYNTEVSIIHSFYYGYVGSILDARRTNTYLESAERLAIEYLVRIHSLEYERWIHEDYLRKF